MFVALTDQMLNAPGSSFPTRRSSLTASTPSVSARGPWMDDVRKSPQKQLPAGQRRCSKCARQLLLKHRNELTDEDGVALDVMLCFSDPLAQGCALKEAFFHFMAAPDSTEADRRLDFWRGACDQLRLSEFKPCRRMLNNWRNSILNAIDVRFSNSFTEGGNNAIKTLKRASFGCQSSSRFCKRILLLFSLHSNI